MSSPSLRKRRSHFTDSSDHESSGEDLHGATGELNNNVNTRRQSLHRQHRVDYQISSDNFLGTKKRTSTQGTLISRLTRKLCWVFGLLALIYVASPFIFRHSTFIQRSLLFMNFVNLPLYLDLSQPELVGLKCTRTLVLQNDDINYGVWHIVPEKSLSRCHHIVEQNRTTIQDEEAFADDAHIVLYYHGNGGSRAGKHRMELYKQFAYKYNYHVITFDYRGYADSSDVLVTATGLNEDAKFIYNWLLSQKHVHRARITVWGHSLGTGISTRMLAEIDPSKRPSSLVLEAPFDTIANAISGHPFSRPFHLVPYFEYFFVDPLMNSDQFHFDSAKRIKLIKDTPIMIMHAKDDGIIPYELGEGLYKQAVKALGKDQVKFVTADVEGLGHKHMCRHEPIMSKVIEFIESNRGRSLG